MTKASLDLCKSIVVLLLYSSLAVILLITDLTGLYDVIWQELDIRAFRALNDTIGPDSRLTTFWAWTNSKAFDKATFFVMLAICIYLVTSTQKEDRLAVVAKIGAIIALIGIAIFVSKRGLDDFYHPSPGLALMTYNNINDFITGYQVKTSTDNSFPGDHAMTGALFSGGIIMLFKDRPYVAVLSVLLTIFVSLPRIAGGGHWLTDVVIGSAAACLILLPWLKYSPLVESIERAITRSWRIAPIYKRK